MCAIHRVFAQSVKQNAGQFNPVAMANQILGDYQEGCVLEASWGYEQTNVNFYVVVKRSNSFITIQEIQANKNPALDGCGTDAMRGVCIPMIENGQYIPVGKPMRRKLAMRDGKVIGCRFETGYGWISAWDGKPVSYSSYH